MNLKLVALDMDGTLLDRDEVISQRNTAAIRSLQKQGVVVTIASGRSFREAREICEISGINPYIISSNGAEINDRDGKTIAGFPIERELSVTIAKWLAENEYYYELTGDTDVYAVKKVRAQHQEQFDAFRQNNPEPEKIIQGIGLEYKLSLREIGIVDSIQAYFEQEKNTYKIHVLSPDLARLEKVKNMFRGMAALEMVSSLDHNVEVMNKIVSKGASVQRLAELLGVSLAETMAIGDNYNDLSMLKMVKYPVAMGNAKDEVKAVCRYTTLSDHDDGVAHAVENFDKIIWR